MMAGIEPSEIHADNPIADGVYPVADLTPAYFRKLLGHLNLTVPDSDDTNAEDAMTVDKMLKLLTYCSPIATTFIGLKPASLNVQFKEDNVVNIFDSSNSVALYPSDCEYPCCVCNFSVDEGEDHKKDQGLLCSQCDRWFHNQCLAVPASDLLYTELSSSPTNVKVVCPKCISDAEVVHREVRSLRVALEEAKSTFMEELASMKELLTHQASSQEESTHQVVSELESVKKVLAECNDPDMIADNVENFKNIHCKLDETCTTLDETNTSLDEMKQSWDSNTAMFTSSLETVVETSKQLNNFDFKALSATACKSVHDITSAVNECILQSDVVEKVSRAVSESISHHEAILSPTIQRQISDTIKEEVGKTNRKLDEMAATSTAESWAALATTSSHEAEYTIAGSRKNKASDKRSSVDGKEGKDTRKNTEMDPTKTISIVNALDKNLASSAKIKSVFNKCHPKMEIIHCKRTMNGFILIEVDTVEHAKDVVDGWDPEEHFASKDADGKVRPTSAVLLEDAQAKAVIDDVDKDLTDAEMTEYLQVDFAKAVARRFINRNGPTYSVLITFKSNSDLEEAKTNNVIICDIPFRVKPYQNKKRVIQCFNCNGFKHVAAVCNKDRACAFCGEGHKESDCLVKKGELKDQYKCTNCGKCHSAIDKTCDAYLKMVKSLGLNDGS